MENDAEGVSPFERAAQDALLYGTGVLVIRFNGVIEHIPPEEYHILAEALNQAQGDYMTGKKLPNK